MNTHARIVPILAFMLSACSIVACHRVTEEPPPSASPTPPAGLPAVCSSSDVFHVRVPYYYDRSSSPTFDYAFQFRTSSNSSAPVVIILGGGPGQTLIGAAAPEGAIPTSYNLIFTDPRGEGCNASQGAPFPVDFFKTEYLARDVLSMISSLRLRDYIIYGASYGTVHATVTASIAERERFNLPKAVVLEGVLGRAFIGGIDEYYQTFVTEWSRLKGILDPRVVAMLSRTPLPLGYSSRDWATFIRLEMISGEVPNSGHPLVNLLNPLVSDDPGRAAAARDALDQAIRSTLALQPTAVSLLFETLFCRELAGKWSVGWDLVGGNLVLSGQDFCPLIKVPFTPYDAADWPVATPIYYFQGPNDPTIAMSNALHHFNVETRSRRNFVVVGGASHAPLAVSLQALGCSNAVWDAIAFNPAGFVSALRQCPNWPIDWTPGNPSP